MVQTLSNMDFSVAFLGSTTKNTHLNFSPIDSFNINQSVNLENGTGDGQADFVWADKNSVGRLGSKTYNLHDDYKDVFNNRLNFTHLKGIQVNNLSTRASLSVTTNGIGFIGGTTPSINVGPSSSTSTNTQDSGWVITPGSADTVTITNLSNEDGLDFEVLFVGVNINDNSSSVSSYSSGSSISSSSPLKSSSSSSSSDSSSSDSSSSFSSLSSSSLSSVSESSSSPLKSSSSSDSSNSSVSSSPSSMSSDSSDSSSGSESSSPLKSSESSESSVSSESSQSSQSSPSSASSGSSGSSGSSNSSQSSVSSESSSSVIQNVETVLLLHMNGVDEGTAFTDDSCSYHTITANGDANTETSTKKFGTASLQVTTAGTGYLSVPDSSDFDFSTNDFTIDCWVYITANGTKTIINHGDMSGSNYWRLGHTDRILEFIATTGGVSFVNFVGSTTISSSTWTHVAIVRNGNTFTLYVDGENDGSRTSSTSMPSPTGVLKVGSNTAGSISYFDGNIDELRVVNGSAVWNSNFTPPTTSYPDCST